MAEHDDFDRQLVPVSLAQANWRILTKARYRKESAMAQFRRPGHLHESPVQGTDDIFGTHNAHPHQLRHTLATQAINRGMRLETIAEMLGHRSMDMTLVYARIANRVVADEYAAVMEQIDAL